MKTSTIIFPIQGENVILAPKKRGFGKGFLNGYGGKKEETDITVEDAAVREFLDESSASCVRGALELVAVIDFYEGEKHIFETHVYFSYLWDGELRETEEMGTPELYPISGVPYDRMWDADKVWLKMAFNGERFRAKSVYNEGMTKQVSFESSPI